MSKATEFGYDATTTRKNRYPKMKKLGVCSPYGEMTPFVWKGKLMRLELRDVRKGLAHTENDPKADAGDSSSDNGCAFG